MEILLRKVSIEDLKRCNYQGHVLIPVDQDISGLPDREMVSKLSWTEKAVRTVKQNASIHKYCSMIADIFNGAGITKRVFYNAKDKEAGWSMESVKSDIWKPIQMAVFSHDKTSKLNTEQVSKVYMHVSRILSEKFNVTQGFPNNRDRG